MPTTNQDLWQLDSKLHKEIKRKKKKKTPGFAAQKKVLEQTGFLVKTKRKK